MQAIVMAHKTLPHFKLMHAPLMSTESDRFMQAVHGVIVRSKNLADPDPRYLRALGKMANANDVLRQARAVQDQTKPEAPKIRAAYEKELAMLDALEGHLDSNKGLLADEERAKAAAFLHEALYAQGTTYRQKKAYVVHEATKQRLLTLAKHPERVIDAEAAAHQASLQMAHDEAKEALHIKKPASPVRILEAKRDLLNQARAVILHANSWAVAEQDRADEVLDLIQPFEDCMVEIKAEAAETRAETQIANSTGGHAGGGSTGKENGVGPVKADVKAANEGLVASATERIAPTTKPATRASIASLFRSGQFLAPSDSNDGVSRKNASVPL